MCGICGGVGPKTQSQETLKKQLLSIEHRGPDDSGMHIGPGFALGMCRLAIVEIQNGKQPTSDDFSDVHLVFNGEIYNYREIRNELQKKGVNFKSSGEAEVIIQSYLLYGPEFVSRLNGMFAIALYDGRTRTLLLIRDRFGKKPLWFSQMNDGSLLFASEVRALKIAIKNLTFRPETISEVMQLGYVKPSKSSFEEINAVPPASILTWNDGQIIQKKYWEARLEQKNKITYVDALENTKVLIKNAVSRRLISERPIGSFLSGGYDSTIVTALMSQLMDSKVQTYSIGFETKQFNEAPHARNIANYLETDHHEEIIRADPELILQKISVLLDQPFADSSIIPTYLVSKFASENLVVALTGDGGDEIFGGYDRYIGVPLLQNINPILPLLKRGMSAFKPIMRNYPHLQNRGHRQLKYMSSLSERYFSVQSLTETDLLRKLIRGGQHTNEIKLEFITQFESSKNLADLDKLIKSDLDFYLPCDILSKIDISSMSNGLELRSPLLDVELAEWVFSLPNDFKVKGFTSKRILKDIAHTMVPKELLDRPKMGFGIPRGEWIRSDLKEMVTDLLTDSTFKQRGWFNSIEVERVLKSHFDGQNLDNVIWPMLMLELWARNWLDN
jgi:asparagine synthase (glutamine-hydrolysing)